jgi:hypothetical protein
VALHWFHWKYVISGDHFHISVATHSSPIAFLSESHCFIVSCINPISFLLLYFFFYDSALLSLIAGCSYTLKSAMQNMYILNKNWPKHRNKLNENQREEFLGYMAHLIELYGANVSYSLVVYMICLFGQSSAHSATHSSLALLLPSLTVIRVTGTLSNTFTNTLTRRHTRDLTRSPLPYSFALSFRHLLIHPPVSLIHEPERNCSGPVR